MLLPLQTRNTHCHKMTLIMRCLWAQTDYDSMHKTRGTACCYSNPKPQTPLEKLAKGPQLKKCILRVQVTYFYKNRVKYQLLISSMKAPL
jgi:hypothetical protein